MPWAGILTCAVAVFLLFAGVMEARLRHIGVAPNVHDSQERWEAERARASRLGEKALILIGASRIQLGADLDVLRAETGLEPVQLAIDGSTPMPVLAGLASDPRIRGTIIVDYYSHTVGNYGGIAQTYQSHFEKGASGKNQLSPYAKSEKYFTEWVQERLSIYSDGANPLNSLLYRVINDDGARSLITTRTDRSRLGDYSKAKMPEYYHRRVARTLGIHLTTFDENTESTLKKLASLTPPQDNSKFIHEAQKVRQQVSAIQTRGGRVFFLEMPSSGMVREVEEKRFPVEKFWKPFTEISGTIGVRSLDHPLLKKFTCPDGSHLDYRDRREFTMAMIQALGLARPGRVN